MKKLIALALLLCLTASANAALHSRFSGQAYYDDVLNITWTADADINGQHDLNMQLNWADSLVIENVADWRLSTAGELENLYWQSSISTSMPQPFTNIAAGGYWSSTLVTESSAVTFDFSGPGSDQTGMEVPLFAWAVADGDVGIVVDIDVDPWSTDNLIRPSSDYPIPVLVKGSSEFDVIQIDPATVHLKYAPNFMASPLLADFDRDAHTDALFGFATEATGVFCNDTEVTITGQTYSAVPFFGADYINASDCSELKCHPDEEPDNGGGLSEAAKQALDNIPNASAIEKAAVVAFVMQSELDGNYDYISEFYVHALSNTDDNSLTGIKQGTKGSNGGDAVHSGNGFVMADAANSYIDLGTTPDDIGAIDDDESFGIYTVSGVYRDGDWLIGNHQSGDDPSQGIKFGGSPWLSFAVQTDSVRGAGGGWTNDALYNNLLLTAERAAGNVCALHGNGSLITGRTVARDANGTSNTNYIVGNRLAGNQSYSSEITVAFSYLGLSGIDYAKLSEAVRTLLIALDVTNAETRFRRTMVVGDSLSSNSRTESLWTAWYTESQLFNHAISGDTLADIEGDFSANAAESAGVDSVVLQGGTNTWNSNESAVDGLADMESMIQQALEMVSVRDIIVMNSPPGGFDPSDPAEAPQEEQRHLYNAGLEELCDQYGVTLYDFDASVRGIGEDYWQIAEAWRHDAYHLNAAGGNKVGWEMDALVVAQRGLDPLK
jgi:hypothetical protein